MLAQYPPFATQWKKVEKVSLRISRQRAQYNNTATSYNRLLGVFPQNLLVAAFGFVPLNIYNSVGGMVAIRTISTRPCERLLLNPTGSRPSMLTDLSRIGNFFFVDLLQMFRR